MTPEIFATITLFASGRGGRQSALSSEYRGVLGIGGEHFSARFEIPAGLTLSPGESLEAGIQFLFPEMALPMFSVGATFTIWEGRDIGTGTVTRVVSRLAISSSIGR